MKSAREVLIEVLDIINEVQELPGPMPLHDRILAILKPEASARVAVQITKEEIRKKVTQLLLELESENV